MFYIESFERHTYHHFISSTLPLILCLENKNDFQVSWQKHCFSFSSCFNNTYFHFILCPFPTFLELYNFKSLEAKQGLAIYYICCLPRCHQPTQYCQLDNTIVSSNLHSINGFSEFYVH